MSAPCFIGAVTNASERTDQRATWPAVGNFKMAPKMNQPVPSLLSSTPASRSRTRTDGSSMRRLASAQPALPTPAMTKSK